MDIVVENLTKSYGSQKAVDNISFRVRTGEVLGFLGPNGAGKTTTMKAITSYLQPTAGSIRVGRYDVQSQPDEVRRRIGYLPENNPLYTDMYVVDYLRFVAELHQIPKDITDRRIMEMIVLCGLEAEKHKKIEELSKGYKQRVGLAQALIHNPEVLILDEPTTGLDPNQIVEIRKLIKDIGREKTVILSSHILAEVEATCDRILIINKGKIVANGTADELRKQSRGTELLRIRIEDGERGAVIDALRQIPSVEMVDPDETDSCRFEIHSRGDMSSARELFGVCVQNGWVLTQLTPVETKLEDVFRELTIH